MATDLFDVYHLKAEAWVASQATGGPVHFPADYELVARVEARSLDEVYEKTSGLDGPWWERADVRCVKPSRSTSVDDVVVGPAGVLHVLGWSGWAHYRCPETQSIEATPSIEPLR